MYVKGQAIEALQRFRDYVTEYQSKLNNKLIEIEQQLSFKVIIDTIKREKDYVFILKNKDVLVRIDNSLDSKLKIIDFFVKNNATSAEQFMNVVNEVINSPVINEFERTIADLSQLQNQIKLNLEQCSLILNNDRYDEEYYIKLLEMSDLSEEDKLNILSDQAFNAVMIQSHDNVIDESKEVNNKSDSKKSDVDSVSSLKIEKRYTKIIADVNDMIGKYYYLIEKQNSNQLKYKKQYMSAIREQSTPIDYDNLSSIQDRLILIILEMIENKQLIEQEMKKIVNHEVSREDEELINLFLDTLEDNLKVSAETSRQFELDKQEENNVGASKVLFLLDDKNQPYINIKDVTIYMLIVVLQLLVLICD